VMSTSLGAHLTALSHTFHLFNVLLFLVFPHMPQSHARRLHLLRLEAGLDHIEWVG